MQGPWWLCAAGYVAPAATLILVLFIPVAFFLDIDTVVCRGFYDTYMAVVVVSAFCGDFVCCQGVNVIAGADLGFIVATKFGIVVCMGLLGVYLRSGGIILHHQRVMVSYLMFVAVAQGLATI